MLYQSKISIMNKLLLPLIGVFFGVFSSFGVYGQTTKSDTLLYQIENKVYEAFLSSFQDNSPKRLIEIENELEKLSELNQMTVYWFVYAKYYEALHYLKIQNKEKFQEVLSYAISILEETENKNSEMYALLAFIQSFSLQYAGMNTATISSKVKENAEMALDLDSANLRAWYVLASTDYYTPVAFGGGKNCEKYLLKTISLNEQTIASPYMPSWGKGDAYALLIGFYVGKENYEKAKEYLNEALSLYPDNYMINQYVEILENK
jgi:tetratricopeptide (TPR) repeat protein